MAYEMQAFAQKNEWDLLHKAFEVVFGIRLRDFVYKNLFYRHKQGGGDDNCKSNL